jgi:hypothetical protein
VNTSGGKQRDFLKGSAEQKWHKKNYKKTKKTKKSLSLSRTAYRGDILQTTSILL